MAKCRLCLEDKKLCNSHIIPEFLYKPVYDAQNHRIIKIGGKHLKKGIREKLLCAACEAKLNRWEAYVRNLLYGEPGPAMEKMDDFILTRGINYQPFKLFQMSLIWRAGISQKPEFQNVQLGPHAEAVRRMLHGENPGQPHEYGCFLIMTPTYYEILSKMMMLAQESRFDSHKVYMFLLAGFTWVFFISGHTAALPHKEKLFLSKEGTLPIAIDDVVSKKYFDRTVEEWFATGKLEVRK